MEREETAKEKGVNRAEKGQVQVVMLMFPSEGHSSVGFQYKAQLRKRERIWKPR